MKGLDYSTAIKETAEELRVLYRRQKRPLARRRLRFLIVLKTGLCSSQAKAGEQIGIKQRASEKLWRLYQVKGIAGLLAPPALASHPNWINGPKKPCKISWTAIRYKPCSRPVILYTQAKALLSAQPPCTSTSKPKASKRKLDVRQVCVKI